MPFSEARAFQLATPSINETIKATVVFGLRMIPEVGSALAALVSLLCPRDSSDRWQEVKLVKYEVERVVNETINDLVYNTIHRK
jgi:hypothetical protein